MSDQRGPPAAHHSSRSESSSPPSSRSTASIPSLASSSASSNSTEYPRIRIKFLGHRDEPLELEYQQEEDEHNFCTGVACQGEQEIHWRVFGNPFRSSNHIYGMDPRDRSGTLEGEKQRIAGKSEKDTRYMGYYVEHQVGTEWIGEDEIANGQSCVVARRHEESWSQQPRAQAIQILQDLGVTPQDAAAVFCLHKQHKPLTWHVPLEDLPGLFQDVRQEFTLSHLERTYFQLLIGTIPNLRLPSKDENWLQWDPQIYQLGVPSQDGPHYNLVRVSDDNERQIDAIDIGYMSKRNGAENDEDDVPDEDEMRVLLELGQGTPTFFRFALDDRPFDDNSTDLPDGEHPHVVGKLARLGDILSDDTLPSPEEYPGQFKIIGITAVDHLRKFSAPGPHAIDSSARGPTAIEPPLHVLPSMEPASTTDDPSSIKPVKPMKRTAEHVPGTS